MYEIISNLRRKSIVWICTLVSLVALCMFETSDDKNDILEELSLTRYQYYLLILAVHWIILRCTSYYIDLIDRKKPHVFLQTLAYCLYLPLLFFGPFVTFDDFRRTYSQCPSSPINGLIKNIARFAFWLFFLEFALHFVYVNATSFQPEVREI